MSATLPPSISNCAPDAFLSSAVYKHMLGKPVDHNDLESIDPEYHKSLVWMLDNDIDGVLDLTFSVERDEFGVTDIVDLVPDGRNIAVTNENKHDYVRLIAEQRLSTDIKDQMGVRFSVLTPPLRWLMFSLLVSSRLFSKGCTRLCRRICSRSSRSENSSSSSRVYPRSTSTSGEPTQVRFPLASRIPLLADT